MSSFAEYDVHSPYHSLNHSAMVSAKVKALDKYGLAANSYALNLFTRIASQHHQFDDVVSAMDIAQQVALMIQNDPDAAKQGMLPMRAEHHKQTSLSYVQLGRVIQPHMVGYGAFWVSLNTALNRNSCVLWRSFDPSSKHAHQLWLEARKKGIGGSDASSVAGVNPWTSAYQLWLDKTDPKPRELEQSWNLYFGHAAEPIIREWFAQKNEKTVVLDGTGYMFRQKHDTWLLADFDGFIKEPDEPWRILEIKTSRSWADWHDEEGNWTIPVQYMAQADHYMAVTGFDQVVFVVMINGYEPQVLRWNRDSERITRLIDAEKDFWKNHVQKGVSPAVETIEDIGLKYPQARKPNTPPVAADTAKFDELAADFTEVSEQIKTLEKRKAQLNTSLALQLAAQSRMNGERYQVSLGMRAGKRAKTVSVKKLEEEE